MELSTAELTTLWDYIDRGDQHSESTQRRWRISGGALASLIELEKNLGLSPFAVELSTLDVEKQNIEIRRILAGPLRGEGAQKVARWIISDWGGIRRIKDETITAMLLQLGAFNYYPNEIQRISSWSKILAFSDMDNHAIYDARTIVAINCALSELGKRENFYLPSGRNKAVVKAQTVLRSSPRQEVGKNYATYISLLKQLSNLRKTSLLNVEMILFANGPKIAGIYFEKHNQD